MKKRFIAGFVCGAVLFGITGVFAGQYLAIENTYPVQVNGNNVSLEGYQINDYTYFKLRDIGDKVGFNVDFQNDTILIDTQGKGIGNTDTVNKNDGLNIKKQDPTYVSINGAEYISAENAMYYVQKFFRDAEKTWNVVYSTDPNGFCQLHLVDLSGPIRSQEVYDLDSVFMDGVRYFTREVFERDVLERIKNYKY